MLNANVYDELDRGISLRMTGNDVASANDDLQELLDIASELRVAPSPEFKLRLLEELTEASLTGLRPIPVPSLRDEQVLPTLFGAGANAYPVHRGSFVASYLAQ